VLKAYGGSKKIEWLEVLAGEKAFNKTGQWLPVETLVRPRRGRPRGALAQRVVAGLMPWKAVHICARAR
jgi:hypothetical protein